MAHTFILIRIDHPDKMELTKIAEHLESLACAGANLADSNLEYAVQTFNPGDNLMEDRDEVIFEALESFTSDWK